MNSRASVQLMNSPEIQSDLLRRVEAIRDTADSIGSGKFAADVRPGKTRAHAMVKTTDAKSIKSCQKHNTLLKAMDSGR